jgi:hypothetical protein
VDAAWTGVGGVFVAAQTRGCGQDSAQSANDAEAPRDGAGNTALRISGWGELVEE